MSKHMLAIWSAYVIVGLGVRVGWGVLVGEGSDGVAENTGAVGVSLASVGLGWGVRVGGVLIVCVAGEPLVGVGLAVEAGIEVGGGLAQAVNSRIIESRTAPRRYLWGSLFNICRSISSLNM